MGKMEVTSLPQVYIGADHGGFATKNQLVSYLQANGFTVIDCGAATEDPEDDYTDYAFAVATHIQADWQKQVTSYGILLCRSGGGMAIAANKVKGIRAVLVSTKDEAVHAREHNNAQIITISADTLPLTEVEIIVDTFLRTQYVPEERHERRIAKIGAYEEKSSL